jgi:hypothetical protein
VIDELRESFYSYGQAEAVFIVSVEMSKLDAELEQDSINPFLDLNCIFNFSLFGSKSGQHNSRSFLVEPLSDLDHLVLFKEIKSQR